MLERMTDQEILDRSKKSTNAYETAAYLEEMKKRGISGGIFEKKQPQPMSGVPQTTLSNQMDMDAPPPPEQQQKGVTPTPAAPAYEFKPKFEMRNPYAAKKAADLIQKEADQKYMEGAQKEAEAAGFKEFAEAEKAKIEQETFENLRLAHEQEAIRRQKIHDEMKAQYEQVKPQSKMDSFLGFIGLALSGKNFPHVLEYLNKSVENDIKKMEKELEVKAPKLAPFAREDAHLRAKLIAEKAFRDMLSKGRNEQALLMGRAAKDQARKAEQARLENEKNLNAMLETQYKQSVQEPTPVEAGQAVKISSIKNPEDIKRIIGIPGEKDKGYIATAQASDVSKIRDSLDQTKKVKGYLMDLMRSSIKLAADKKSIFYNPRFSYEKWKNDRIRGAMVLVEKERQNLGVLQKLDEAALERIFPSDPTNFGVDAERVMQEFNFIMNQVDQEMRDKLATYKIPADAKLWNPSGKK